MPDPVRITRVRDLDAEPGRTAGGAAAQGAEWSHSSKCGAGEYGVRDGKQGTVLVQLAVRVGRIAHALDLARVTAAAASSFAILCLWRPDTIPRTSLATARGAASSAARPRA